MHYLVSIFSCTYIHFTLLYFFSYIFFLIFIMFYLFIYLFFHFYAYKEQL